ncbi:uncharacterized protein N7511_003665 [Penicillium nucicola]|uniref:uncharacterized protein n=1 Tax=Penicillium nucicola TaxID=1850975 RepID=UPI00254577BC|nr:uncharacterized protein N7511_003665 [Penicillium nucicola]KAJ5766049.1 hypothetical protein N7511_003665 [Penicillium nucicola]
MAATQESTQPTADPRRMGMSNSGFEDQDVSDIICTLHPNSRVAHDAVTATRKVSPQHIHQRDELDDESQTPTMDLALRLSSSVQNLGMGFCFGRNPARCDVLLTVDDAAKRVSNAHFRIYLTGDGILMLQDTSTNGTVVDNCRLRKTQKENSRMLVNGSVIQVVIGDHASDEVRFLVRIPPREGFAVQYERNLLKYFERVLAAAPRHKERTGPHPSVLTWSSSKPYGMHWTGGSMYNVTGQIGKGAFATVYKIATKQQGAVFAAKELDKRRFMKNGILDQKVDNEMKIMRDLTHPNIVQYVDYHEHDRWIYIIMEYVPGGELSTYLQTQGRIAEEMVRTIARQVLRALHYLHKRKITHRDIKPDNILISSLEPLKIKLSDFGLSKVTEQETFLKTFCGTLLYCAPEVYPDYEQYRRGEFRKRRRVGDPQSVDMWSLGAVLFHILSGVPPYSGRAEDRGVQMLRTIMTSDADFDVLRQAGISEDGVDFVAQLLNRDPFLRPTEKECFQHPWIATVPDVDDYEDDDLLSECHGGLSIIGEDPEDELDASQLSIADGPGFANGADEDEHNSSEALAKKPRIEYVPTSVRYPSLPKIESFQDSQAYVDQQAKRLFGEIPSSALQSSHALGNIGAYDFDHIQIEEYASSGESMMNDDPSDSIISLPENPFGGTAPSLMGAEKLVGELNMNSVHSIMHFKAGAVNESSTRQTTPGDAKEPASPPSLNNRSSDSVPPTSSPQETPKAKFTRRIDLAVPDTASEASTDSSPQNSQEAPVPVTLARLRKPSYDPELATTLDAQTGEAILEQFQEESEPCEPIIHQPSINPESFAKPPKRYGKLRALPGSVFDLTIFLENRLTSWGRGPLATIQHTDITDTRIPAYALELTFWAPGIEAKIATGENWQEIPGVMAIISTKARMGIHVNGTLLQRGPPNENRPNQLPFGKLYNGDVITVYRHKKKFLKLQCEFTFGDSAQSRPANEPFSMRQGLMTKAGAANRLPTRSAQKYRDRD